ncbi:MAG TPA: hypothetical protein VFU03_08815 [Gemmatimonadales bacterium]|nr:hypothetical protein [Gemmatimonadales bacterium]
MTKRMLAVLPLICVLMIAMGGNAAAPTANTSTAPYVIAPTPPAMSTPADPGWGGCRWYCGSKSYPSASQCAANCSFACEVIC